MSEGVLHVTDSRTSQEYQIPIHRNAIQAVDFQAIKGPVANSDLADQVGNGLRLFDPGFKNTAVSESKITFIDGSQGIVQYRGQNIADFWQTAEFEDLLHLLVWAQWPSAEEKETLRSALVKAAENVPESVKTVIRAFPKSAAPMQMIIAGLATYLGEDPKSIPAYSGRNLYQGNLQLVDKAIIRTLAAFQVCAGLAASHRNGIPFTGVDANGNFLSNLFTMMGKVDKNTGKPDPNAIRAIQRIWALGADLGHTNSTSAFLLGASTLSDPLSCLISALSSGYGILHFGAAEASFKSLAAIGSKKNVPFVINKVKRREAKLYGYGHRMFNTIDPRIVFGAQILNDLNSKHPLVEVAMEIDRIAGEDEYFVSRKLQANADLFIGIIYTALDFDPSFVPVMIALMRSGGMMAHWREAMSQTKTNIWRPQQFYTGVVGATAVEKTAKGAEDAADAHTTVLENLVDLPASDSASEPEKAEAISNILETDEMKALKSALRSEITATKTPVVVAVNEVSSDTESASSLHLPTINTPVILTVSQASSDTESVSSSCLASQVSSDTESLPPSPLPTGKSGETVVPAFALEA